MEELDYNALVAGGDEQPTQIRSMKIYDGKGYYVTVRLSDIHGSMITSVEDDDGKDIAGLFIPFKDSGVTVTPKKNVLLVAKMETAQVPSSKHTHLLSQIVDRDIFARWRHLGFSQSFIGFARPFNWKNKRK